MPRFEEYFDDFMRAEMKRQGVNHPDKLSPGTINSIRRLAEQNAMRSNDRLMGSRRNLFNGRSVNFRDEINKSLIKKGEQEIAPTVKGMVKDSRAIAEAKYLGMDHNQIRAAKRKEAYDAIFEKGISKEEQIRRAEVYDAIRHPRSQPIAPGFKPALKKLSPMEIRITALEDITNKLKDINPWLAARFRDRGDIMANGLGKIGMAELPDEILTRILRRAAELTSPNFDPTKENPNALITEMDKFIKNNFNPTRGAGKGGPIAYLKEWGINPDTVPDTYSPRITNNAKSNLLTGQSDVPLLAGPNNPDQIKMSEAQFLRNQVAEKEAQLRALAAESQQAATQARKQGFMRGKTGGMFSAALLIPSIPEAMQTAGRVNAQGGNYIDYMNAMVPEVPGLDNFIRRK